MQRLIRKALRFDFSHKTANGVFQLKADGWSGAGRMFRRYEGEADALYISITDYTGSSLMLHVEGFGSFPFQAVAC